MTSSIHIDNKKKDILILVRGPMQGLESTLTAEKMYSINFTVTKKKFCLSLHCNGANSYLFVNLSMVQKILICQKIQRLQQVHYAQETYQKIGQQII